MFLLLSRSLGYLGSRSGSVCVQVVWAGRAGIEEALGVAFGLWIGDRCDWSSGLELMVW